MCTFTAAPPTCSRFHFGRKRMCFCAVRLCDLPPSLISFHLSHRLCVSCLPAYPVALSLHFWPGDFACPYRFSANLGGSAPSLRRTSVACESESENEFESEVSLVALSSFVSQQQRSSSSSTAIAAAAAASVPLFRFVT